MNDAQLGALSAQIRDAIDDWCRENMGDDRRHHMGASELGDVCDRRTWYRFRWVMLPDFEGRMRRLFARGHEEEAKLSQWLLNIGAKIWTLDEYGNQFRLKTPSGHVGGSIDGVCILPEQFNFPFPLLMEDKTHNTKSFSHLAANGLKSSKPKHWAQMCQYGFAFKLEYGLYFPVNKNDDDLLPTVVKLDWALGEKLLRKGEELVGMQSAPRRYAENPTVFECKFCDFLDVCHRARVPDKNCRSCRFAVPTAEGQWGCNVHKVVLAKDFLPKGCDKWAPVEQ